MNQTVVSQEFASLSCEASGVLRPTITWYKTVAGIPRMSVLQDSDTIITQEVVDNRTQRSVLQVNNSQPSDDALYTCVAWNIAGSDEGSARLTVLGTYRLTAQPVVLEYDALQGNVRYITDILNSGVSLTECTNCQ